jgi:conjugative relaxase-like TrwC/TraI family protein
MTASIRALGCGRAAGTYYTDDPNRETRTRARDDYYVGEGGGSWWSSGASIVRHGAAVDKATFQDLCGGIDPRSGKGLVRGSGDSHRAGWDLTFSAPKSFSILWMAGTAEQRAVLERVQQEAVDEALRFIVDERLVEVRLGAGGSRREAPTDVIVAKFPHFTSREGDASCHVHCIIHNVGRSPDGVFRTLEPRKAYQWQVTIGSAFRSALAERLAALDFSLRPAGRGQLDIAGIPAPVIEAFSKRSGQVRKFAGADASAAQKEFAVLATRRAKTDVPTRDELEHRWRQELAVFDIDPWAAARDAGRAPRPQPDPAVDRNFNPPEIAGESPVVVAASALFRHESVLTRRDLLHRALIEASLRGAGIRSVYAGIASLESNGTLVRLGEPAAGECWTTPAIAAEEARMLRIAERNLSGSWFRADAVEAALDATPMLSAEQRHAVRHAASADGISLLESGAGTGKTTLARALVFAARKSHLTILALAPSWVAADEISRSTGIEAVAIARFRHELARGLRPAPDDRTLILLDEAGMVGTRDMAAILEAANPADPTGTNATGTNVRGAKTVLIADRRQLSSVAGASALQAVADCIERKATLTEVRRQLVDWQRVASTVMARGDSEAGLRAYVENDRVDLVPGREAAQARTIDVWRDLRRRYGDNVIMVTRRNRDAASLNRIARIVRRGEGLIRGDDMNVPTVDRDGEQCLLALARGDRIRFGETLPHHKIRNGNRAVVERIGSGPHDSVRIAVRLEDGRLVEDDWRGFTRKGRGKRSAAPRIVHADAGTAYSVQGRTSAATVLHISSATDARELYVALTRHRHDARVVVESDRLDAVCRVRQADPRMLPPRSTVLERLFDEARQYSEKVNVVDFVEDRARFIETGLIRTLQPAPRLDIARVAAAARRFASTARMIGERGWALDTLFQRLTQRPCPVWHMPDAVRAVVSKIQTWINRRSPARGLALRTSLEPDLGR